MDFQRVVLVGLEELGGGLVSLGHVPEEKPVEGRNDQEDHEPNRPARLSLMDEIASSLCLNLDVANFLQSLSNLL